MLHITESRGKNSVVQKKIPVMCCCICIYLLQHCLQLHDHDLYIYSDLSRITYKGRFKVSQTTVYARIFTVFFTVSYNLSYFLYVIVVDMMEVSLVVYKLLILLISFLGVISLILI